jgi:hypothetical protein
MLFSIFTLLAPILDKLIPDVNARLQAKEELEKALAANQAALVTAMKDTMAADAQSESTLTRIARPLVVLWSLAMISWVVASPIFNLQTETLKALAGVPDSLWNLVSIGIGGYMLARTVEKGLATWKGK